MRLGDNENKFCHTEKLYHFNCFSFTLEQLTAQDIKSTD